MEAIYHILTDLPCRVHHFGKEICVANPEEDAFITLRKGKHILLFVSVDNPSDFYRLMLEVPENDIESFVEVELTPIRQERLNRERVMIEEQERVDAEIRKREEERIQAERERVDAEIRKREEERIQAERERKRQEKEKLRKEREERELQAHRLLLTQCRQIFVRAKRFDDSYNWRNDFELQPFEESAEYGSIIGYKKGDSIIIPPKYYGHRDHNGDYSLYNCLFHDGLVGLKKKSDTLAFGFKTLFKLGYIGKNGEEIIPFDYSRGTPFRYGKALVVIPDKKDLKTETIPKKAYNDFLDHFTDKQISTISVCGESVYEGQEFISYQAPKYRSGQLICIDHFGDTVFVVNSILDHNYMCFPSPFSQGLAVLIWCENPDKWSLFSGKRVSAMQIIDFDGNIIATKYVSAERLFYTGKFPSLFTNGVACLSMIREGEEDISSPLECKHYITWDGNLINI